MERISRHHMLMQMAMTASLRSTCQRKQVGALLAIDGRPISIGYGGAPSHFPHCDESICDLTKPCTRTVHAEANAIAFAARKGIATEGSALYCTLAPCLDCAKLIINAGVLEVFYLEMYRSDEGLDLFRRAGTYVRQIQLASYA